MAADVLSVGDVMRWSVELFADVKARTEERDILVRVVSIERCEDGTVKLWLTNADDANLAAGQVN